MGLKRVALSALALASYLLAAVSGLYALLLVWVTVRTASASAAVGVMASLGATVFCVVLGKALSQRSDGIVGYGGDSDWGKVLGPR